MADDQKRNDPGDMFRESVRAVGGVIGAFKEAIEQTFNDLSESGDIAPDRAREAARDAMKRAQDAVEDMRTRVDFVSRREFDDLKSELTTLRQQMEQHLGTTPGGAGGAAPGTGSPGVDDPTGGAGFGGTGGG
jgi:polyhydroxyalkanoate synthesis regulator phasin